MGEKYITLKKGQKVVMKSGATLVVDSFSDNYFWAGKDSLPYWRGDIIS